MAEEPNGDEFTLTDLSGHIQSQEAFLRHVASVSKPVEDTISEDLAQALIDYLPAYNAYKVNGGDWKTEKAVEALIRYRKQVPYEGPMTAWEVHFRRAADSEFNDG